jgi:hypothetical protein
MKKRFFKKRGLLSVVMVFVIIMSTLFVLNPLQAASTVTLTGYVSPDLSFSSTAAPIVKAGFNVSLEGTDYSSVTDKNGYFEISGIPQGSTYNVQILKSGYLMRESGRIDFYSDIRLFNNDDPVLMWCGDMNLDWAINMTDIIYIAKSFNTSEGMSNYASKCDFNRDNAINMTDIMAVAKNFNKSLQAILQLITLRLLLLHSLFRLLPLPLRLCRHFLQGIIR